MKTNLKCSGWFLSGALTLCVAAQADVKMPTFFGDNMIFQRGVQAPVWGWADPGEKVTVKIAGQTKEATTGADGKWMVKLDPLSVTENATLQINGNNAIAINNVAVGEVWIASGQSNMEWVLRNTHDLPNALADSNDPQFRLFTVQKATSEKPLTDVKGKWLPSNPDNAPSFSAVGWYFGRELRKKLNVPVGVINTSWGGTPAEAWTSLPQLQTEPDFKPMLDGWEKRLADHPAQLEKYNTVTLPAWEEAKKKAKEEGKPEPQRPRAPDGGALSPNRPANLYNAMIAPLVPFASRGAIWYQGESNAGRAYQYRKLMPAMIADWRKAWGIQKPQDFSFYMVQLANFMAPRPEPGDSAWAELREAQSMTALQPGNGQGLSIDIGEEKDIHPRNKRDVGLRLALAALAQTYGQKIEYSGPLYASHKVEGNKIRVKLTHADGLMSKAADAEGIPGFAIAGEDKKWKWAKVRIEGSDIVLWHDEIPSPVAARYAWADNPKATVYNAAGLPAVPFRTDDWPGVTINNK